MDLFFKICQLSFQWTQCDLVINLYFWGHSLIVVFLVKCPSPILHLTQYFLFYQNNETEKKSRSMASNRTSSRMETEKKDKALPPYTCTEGQTKRNSGNTIWQIFLFPIVKTSWDGSRVASQQHTKL